MRKCLFCYATVFQNCKQTNEHFTHIILGKYVRKLPLRTKSTLLYNFATDFIIVSCIVLEIGTLASNFTTNGCCNSSHAKAHSHFAIHRHSFYHYSCQRLKGMIIVRFSRTRKCYFPICAYFYYKKQQHNFPSNKQFFSVTFSY